MDPNVSLTWKIVNIFWPLHWFALMSFSFFLSALQDVEYNTCSACYVLHVLLYSHVLYSKMSIGEEEEVLTDICHGQGKQLCIQGGCTHLPHPCSVFIFQKAKIKSLQCFLQCPIPLEDMLHFKQFSPHLRHTADMTTFRCCRQRFGCFNSCALPGVWAAYNCWSNWIASLNSKKFSRLPCALARQGKEWNMCDNY